MDAHITSFLFYVLLSHICSPAKVHVLKAIWRIINSRPRVHTAVHVQDQGQAQVSN